MLQQTLCAATQGCSGPRLPLGGFGRRRGKERGKRRHERERKEERNREKDWEKKRIMVREGDKRRNKERE